jgi:hypothetical protein
MDKSEKGEKKKEEAMARDELVATLQAHPTY